VNFSFIYFTPPIFQTNFDGLTDSLVSRLLHKPWFSLWSYHDQKAQHLSTPLSLILGYVPFYLLFPITVQINFTFPPFFSSSVDTKIDFFALTPALPRSK